MNLHCLIVVMFLVTSCDVLVECKPSSSRTGKRSDDNEYPNSSTQTKHHEAVDPTLSWKAFLEKSKVAEDAGNYEEMAAKKIREINYDPIVDPMGEEIRRVVQEQVARALGMRSPADYIFRRDANSSAAAVALIPPPSPFGARIVFQRGQRANVAVKPRSFVELKYFHTTSFDKNERTTTRGSRFYAPFSGLYQLSTNLHFSISKENPSKRKDAARNKHLVRLLICVNSLCQKNKSLEYFAPTNRRSRVFSVSFAGFLPLKVGQYASVFIENSSLEAVSLLGGSSFSGMCIQ